MTIIWMVALLETLWRSLTILVRVSFLGMGTILRMVTILGMVNILEMVGVLGIFTILRVGYLILDL